MEYWNSGKMECWGSKADDGLILFIDHCHSYKNSSLSAKRGFSVFQHSIIPIPHGIQLRHPLSADYL
jgi:hypothetical protein